MCHACLEFVLGTSKLIWEILNGTKICEVGMASLLVFICALYIDGGKDFRQLGYIKYYNVNLETFLREREAIYKLRQETVRKTCEKFGLNHENFKESVVNHDILHCSHHNVITL